MGHLHLDLSYGCDFYDTSQMDGITNPYICRKCVVGFTFWDDVCFNPETAGNEFTGTWIPFAIEAVGFDYMDSQYPSHIIGLDMGNKKPWPVRLVFPSVQSLMGIPVNRVHWRANTVTCTLYF